MGIDLSTLPGGKKWLHLTNLHFEVTETTLYERFSGFGKLLSILITHDFRNQEKFLGYAFIKYENSSDARRAKDALNSIPLIDKPLQIERIFEANVFDLKSDLIWPTVQTRVIGIFINNLDPSITSKDIYDTFSPLSGNTQNCNVCKSLFGVSKSCAVLNFVATVDPVEVIKSVPMGAKYATIFFSGEQLFDGESIMCQGCNGRQKNTVSVKNFPESYTEEQLKELFLQYGQITSCHIFMNASGKSECLGFVSFVYSGSARNACAKLSGFEIEQNNLQVDLLMNIEDYKMFVFWNEKLLYDKFQRCCNAFKMLELQKSKTSNWKHRTSESLWFYLISEITPSGHGYGIQEY